MGSELCIASLVTAHSNSKTSNPQLKIINPSKPSNNQKQGHSFKLLKACNSCRKRKQKCELTANWNMCKSCEVNKRECIFEHKFMDVSKVKKRKKKSDKEKQVEPPVVSKLAVKDNDINSILNEDPLLEELKNTNFIGNLIGKNYNIHISNDLEDNIFNLNIFSPDKSLDGSMKSLYFNTVANSTPFIIESVFNYPLDDFSCCCIEIAANIDSNKTGGGTTDTNNEFKHADLLAKLYHHLQSPIIWNECNLSCFFLLPLRISLDYAVIKSALLALNDKIADLSSPNLMVGAYVVDAWTSCFHRQPIVLSPTHLAKCWDFLATLNDKSFSYQIYIIGIHLYKIKWLMFSNINKLELLQLEYDILLWPVKLSTEFTILKDRLFGSPESFTLHIIHNSLLLNYYTFAIANMNIGSTISLFAVPGLYHFLSELAKSTYRVNVNQYENWCLISECRVMSSTLLLKLNEIMDFEPFKKTLLLFKKNPQVYDKNYQDCIYNDVQKVIATRDLDDDDDDDEADGGRVYWVFRDTRSMSLHMYLEGPRSPP